MNDFFKSEMVRGDLQEMSDLQQYCMRAMAAFPALSPDKRLEYFSVLEQLIEKQKIFYARLKLSDDPEAIEMAENMKMSAAMLGADPDVDLLSMFDNLLKKLSEMKQKLEETGG